MRIEHKNVLVRSKHEKERKKVKKFYKFAELKFETKFRWNCIEN